MLPQMVDPAGPKQCPGCGRTFYGRDNKMHCSTRCKNKVAYKKNKPVLAKQRQCMKALKQNEAILLRLDERFLDAHRMAVNLLHYEGFDFTLFTQVEEKKKLHVVVHWLFTAGWSRNSDGTYWIHRRSG